MIFIITKGGEGSGNFGHAGRPGQVGGSAPDKTEEQKKSGMQSLEELDGTLIKKSVDDAII